MNLQYKKEKNSEKIGWLVIIIIFLIFFFVFSIYLRSEEEKTIDKFQLSNLCLVKIDIPSDPKYYPSIYPDWAPISEKDKYGILYGGYIVYALERKEAWIKIKVPFFIQKFNVRVQAGEKRGIIEENGTNTYTKPVARKENLMAQFKKGVEFDITESMPNWYSGEITGWLYMYGDNKNLITVGRVLPLEKVPTEDLIQEIKENINKTKEKIDNINSKVELIQEKVQDVVTKNDIKNWFLWLVGFFLSGGGFIYLIDKIIKKRSKS